MSTQNRFAALTSFAPQAQQKKQQSAVPTPKQRAEERKRQEAAAEEERKRRTTNRPNTIMAAATTTLTDADDGSFTAVKAKKGGKVTKDDTKRNNNKKGGRGGRGRGRGRGGNRGGNNANRGGNRGADRRNKTGHSGPTQSYIDNKRGKKVFDRKSETPVKSETKEGGAFNFGDEVESQIQAEDDWANDEVNVTPEPVEEYFSEKPLEEGEEVPVFKGMGHLEKEKEEKRAELQRLLEEHNITPTAAEEAEFVQPAIKKKEYEIEEEDKVLFGAGKKKRARKNKKQQNVVSDDLINFVTKPHKGQNMPREDQPRGARRGGRRNGGNNGRGRGRGRGRGGRGRGRGGLKISANAFPPLGGVATDTQAAPSWNVNQ